MAIGEDVSRKAKSLHERTFIHDYYPLALPLEVDEEMLAFMHQAIAEEVNGNVVVYEFFNFYLKRLEAGGAPAEAMRKRLDDLVSKAGVNCVTLTLGNASRPLDDYPAILASREWWGRFFLAYPRLKLCTTAREIRRAYDGGGLGIFLALQDMGCIGQDLSRLEKLHGLGVRVGQLTYNGPNALGSGCGVPPEQGLSAFGRDAVSEMNRVGILVDLSHCNTRTTMEGMEASSVSPIISHSSCKAVFDHARAKGDDELKVLADRDGFFGLYSVPFFLTDQQNPDFTVFLRHLEHAADILGLGRIGIGTDWGLWSADVPPELMEAMVAAARKMGFSKSMNLTLGTALDGFRDYTDWIRITEALVSAGYSDEDIQGLLGGNYLQYLDRAGLY